MGCAMGEVIVLHRWLVFDEVRGRLIKTRYVATEEQIRIAHPEATVIEGTREERVIDEDPQAMSTSAFLHPKQ